MRRAHVGGRDGLAADDARTKMRFAHPTAVMRLERGRQRVARHNVDVGGQAFRGHVELEDDLGPCIGPRPFITVDGGERLHELDHRRLAKVGGDVDFGIRDQPIKQFT